MKLDRARAAAGDVADQAAREIARTAPATRRADVAVHGASARQANLADATTRCREVADLLGLDAAGVAVQREDGRRLAWWNASTSPPLPLHVDDVLEGRVDGWIVSPLTGGTVFGRLTPGSDVRSAEKLQDLGASLVSAFDGATLDPIDDDGLERLLRQPYGEEASSRSDAPDDVGAIEQIARAASGALGRPGATIGAILGAVRGAIEADEIFFLSERGTGFDVATTSSARAGRVPPEVASTLLTGGEKRADEATLRRLGVVLGASSPTLTGAFWSQGGGRHALIVGCDENSRRDEGTVRAAGRVIGLAEQAILRDETEIEHRVQQERTRIAYEIHDGLTQVVTTAVLELGDLGQRIERDPQAAIDAVSNVRMEIRRSLAELRGVLFDLQRDEASGSRTAEPLSSYVRELADRWGLASTVIVDGDLDAVPRKLLATAYVVVRESVTNTAKHAGADRVDIRLHARPSELAIEIEDQGKGFALPADPEADGHFGLGMLRKRVTEADGTIEIVSSPGKGTRVAARLPVRQEGVVL